MQGVLMWGDCLFGGIRQEWSFRAANSETNQVPFIRKRCKWKPSDSIL